MSLIKASSLNVITVDGATIPLTSRIKILTGYASDPTNNKFSFRLPGDTSGYKNASGFTVLGFKVKPVNSTAIGGAFFASMAYTDNDLGIETNTAATNPVNPQGVSSLGTSGMLGSGAAPGQNAVEVFLGSWSIPANKYLSAQVSGTGGARVLVEAIIQTP